MRAKLLISLSLGFTFAACADHSGSRVANGNVPEAPTSADDGSSGGPGTKDGSEPTVVVPEPEVPTHYQPGDGTDGVPGGQPVPEPGTLLLVGSGLAGLALVRRRRRPDAAA